MTIAATANASRNGSQTYSGSFWRRGLIATALLFSDLACFTCADLLLHLLDSPPGIALFRGGVPGRTGSIIDLIMILAVAFVIARYLAGDYSRRKLFWDGARSTTGALMLCGALYLAALFLLKPSGLWLSSAIWLLLIMAIPSARQLTRLLLAQCGVWYQPTAIIGVSPTACEVHPVLGRQLSLGLDVRWVVVGDDVHRPVPSPLFQLVPIYAGPQNLVETLIGLGCRQVILIPGDDALADQTQLIDQMVGSEIEVAVVPSLRRLPLFGMSTSYFFGKDLLLLQVRNNLARLPQRVLKRAMDVVGGAVALTLLAPLFVIVAFLIKREDGGPVFFIQNRIGRNGKEFRCWKFRTMAVDAEAQMAKWAKENPALLASYRESNFKLKVDPRVTRVGAWLRRKSIDEFPQIFNIVMGEMSLVGPRPLLPRELPDYGPVIALYSRVRPGLTGLWQISGRSHTTFAERVSYDEWYIKNWTVWYDIVIMLQTVWVLLRGEGAY